MVNLNIAHLGPKATFTHEAALKYFDKGNNFIALDCIDDVFREVMSGDADFGVVPAENSIGGTIVNTFDLFIETELKVFDQVTLEIVQNLLSRTTVDKIRRIYTHPQSFRQCARYLAKKFKGVDCVETTSNAKAAMMAAQEPNSASIGPKLCSSEYGLTLIEEGINDFEYNETKFFIIAKKTHDTLKHYSMILFSFPDKPGRLFELIKILKKNKINMTRIESRPSKKKKWHYVFIIEFENSISEKKMQKMLHKFEKQCTFYKYLGSY